VLDSIQKSKIELVNTEKLCFDPQNPRLAGYPREDISSQDQILKTLWEIMDVKEIVMSIAASGFFQWEPLMVAVEEGEFLVIEGNRRLAAVKLIVEPNLAKRLKISIPEVPETVKKGLEKLPVVTVSRMQSWRFLGFKHVNGPARWDSYAKSKYIAEVHINYGIPLDDIGKQIGDTHKTVQKLFRGYRVLEQAEEEKVYSREQRFNKRFHFSHLYTGLQYEGFTDFLGLSPLEAEEKNPVPETHYEKLKEIMVWLFGDRENQIESIIKSQNPDLRNLDAVLKNREAAASLRSGTDLDEAFELTRPKSQIFDEELIVAKKALTKASSIRAISYDGSREVLTIAFEILGIAESLYDEMERRYKASQGKETTSKPRELPD